MTLYGTTPGSRVPATTSRPQLGLLGSLAGVILALKPTSRGSPAVPSWLRRDIGLPPADEPRSFWDYR